MNAIAIAIIGYFLISLEAVVSKFLLTDKVKSWKLYVFYVGLLSLCSLFFIPGFYLVWNGNLGIRLVSWKIFALALVSGVIFFAYLGFLYHALQKSTASRVYVFSGAISTVATFLLAKVFLAETLSFHQIIGLILLLLGGLLIALKINLFRYDKVSKKRRQKVGFFEGFQSALISGILLAISLILLKYCYVEMGNFASGYVYTRLGVGLATLVALMFPSFRNDILKSLQGNKASENTSQFVGVTGAKILSGSGTLLVNIAISYGSVTLINALVSAQYLFTFLLSLVLSIFFQRIYSENLQGSNVLYKTLGVVLVIVGAVFAFNVN